MKESAKGRFFENPETSRLLTFLYQKTDAAMFLIIQFSIALFQQACFSDFTIGFQAIRPKLGTPYTIYLSRKMLKSKYW